MRSPTAAAALLATACLLLLLGTAAAADPYANWTLSLLQDAAEQHGAVCLDGTAPGYYMSPGADLDGEGGTGHWMVHWQGGGWCTSLNDCAGRAKGALGSSKTFATDKDTILGGYDGGAHGLFSSDPAINPRFWNWTKVYVRYCDGASFGGNVEAPVTVPGQSDKIYFRGRRVLDAVMADLLAKGLDKAEGFLVNGCSAGGLSVWLHLDYIRSLVPTGVVVKGVPECGFFMDEPAEDGSPHWTPMYAAVDAMQNVTGSGSANADCISTTPVDQRHRCFMAQYTLPHIKTPLFAVNSVYDAWQASNILEVPRDCQTDMGKCTNEGDASMESLRTDMLSNMTAHVDTHHSVAWTYNCVTHCGQLAHDDRWGVLTSADGSMTLRDAIGAWWFGDVAASKLQSYAKEGWGAKGNPTCS